MNTNHLFQLRALEVILRKPPEVALTKEGVLTALNEQLSNEGLDTISERSLANLFAELKQYGAEVKTKKLRSGATGRYHYVRYISTQESVLSDALSADQEDTIREVLKELDTIQGNPMIDELRVILGERLEWASDELGDDMIVHFDERANYLGRKQIRVFYEAIKNKEALRFNYRPFDRSGECVHFSPYVLKENNHRWFCIGKLQGSAFPLTNVALDRIDDDPVPAPGYIPTSFSRSDWNDYFQEIIGVTHFDQAPVDVILHIYGKSRWYIFTKPLSMSQLPLKEEDLQHEPLVVKLEGIIPNYELKQLILSFGADAEVVEPPILRREMGEIAKGLARRYNNIRTEP